MAIGKKRVLLPWRLKFWTYTNFIFFITGETSMHKYEVTQGPLTLSPGIIVHLNKEQADLRQHALKKCKEGVYEIVEAVQFKNGEVIGFDEIPNKAILSAFFPVEKIKVIQEEANHEKDDAEKPNPTSTLKLNPKVLGNKSSIGSASPLSTQHKKE
jgi:hypothetical protein